MAPKLNKVKCGSFQQVQYGIQNWTNVHNGPVSVYGANKTSVGYLEYSLFYISITISIILATSAYLYT